MQKKTKTGFGYMEYSHHVGHNLEFTQRSCVVRRASVDVYGQLRVHENTKLSSATPHVYCLDCHYYLRDPEIYIDSESEGG